MLVGENLSASRGRRELFSNLSFSLTPAHWLRICGNNGVGKTTFLRRVCGLTHSGGGTLLWRGIPLKDSIDYFQQRVWCGHLDGLRHSLPATENLHFLCALAGITPTPAAVKSALRLLGLERAVNLQLPVSALSRGQRQRVSLARLLLLPGCLWILDEPFTNLDGEMIAWLKGKMIDHVQNGGLLLFTSHHTVALSEDTGTSITLVEKSTP